MLIIKNDLVMNNNFKLFASCLLVNGASRSTICDTQRGNIHFIPNILHEILTLHSSKTIEQIKKEYENKADKIIDEYFDFLISNDLIFYTKELDLFPPLNQEWRSPSQATNSIIDFDENSSHNLQKICSELDEVNCKGLEIRFFDIVSLQFLNKLLTLLNESKLRSIDLLLKYSKEFTESALENLSHSYKKVTSIVLHSAEKDANFDIEVGSLTTKMMFVTENVSPTKHCGIVSTNYFSINQNLFFESINHNSCLNRKISIDSSGKIKNCPSMNNDYGHHSNTTLLEALNTNGFKKYWDIGKDQIEICKDCEFRHVCTDCRVYLEKPEDKLSKPLKCGYNPYDNTWSDWSENPLKHKAIEHYGLQGFIGENAK